MANSIGADLDYEITSQDKGIYGDVDIYRVVSSYDLALIKELASGQANIVGAGATVNYVQSRSKTKASWTPAPLSCTIAFLPGWHSTAPRVAGFSCSHNSGLVTCNFTGNLTTGQTAMIALALTVQDVAQAPFRNWAEIFEDSGTDIDSDPGDNNGNDSGPGVGSPGTDPVVDHNDIDHQAPNNDRNTDEDDSDYEDVGVATVEPLSLGNRVYLDNGASGGTRQQRSPGKR